MNGIKNSARHKNKPLVSIVTPSLNQGRFIEETIQSVLMQDYPYIEYIVVDGGSTDNTIDILKKYEGRLTWISEKDRSTEDAVNKGFRMSTGEILGWIASDDIYDPGAISRVVDFFTSHDDIKMVYGKAHYIDSEGNKIWPYPTEAFNYKKLAVYNYISQPSTFFTRDAFFDSGEMSLDLKYETDYDLWIRIAQRYKVDYLNEFLGNYRVHKGSKTVYKNLLDNFDERLRVTVQHYKWAPANRVYLYSYYFIKNSFPSHIEGHKLRFQFKVLSKFFVEYLRLNKRIRLLDIKFLPRHLLKFFRGWEIQDIPKHVKEKYLKDC